MRLPLQRRQRCVACDALDCPRGRWPRAVESLLKRPKRAGGGERTERVVCFEAVASGCRFRVGLVDALLHRSLLLSLLSRVRFAAAARVR